MKLAKPPQTTPSSMREARTENQLSIAPPPELIYHILIFLDTASVSSFLGEADANYSEWARFFHEVLTAFLSYLSSDNDKLRLLSHRVTRKFLVEGSIALWGKSEAPPTNTFITNFWKHTYVSYL